LWNQAVAKKIAFVLVMIATLCVTSSLLGVWARHKIEKRLKIETAGKFIPTFMATSFYLKDAHFDWDDKVQFLSGDLKVDFDLLSIFKEKMRVRFSANNIAVKLIGDWAKTQGVGDIFLDHFDADMELGPKGKLSEIYSVNADSRKFQFHIKKSEN